MTEPAPDRVAIEVTLQRPGIVVLADIFDPGWRLSIDGRPAPILRANLLMRAAAVAAGSHTLVFTYRPASVRIGAWISLSGLAALAGLAAWASRRPDRPEASARGSTPEVNPAAARVAAGP